jgi:hypothetical protein
LSIIKMLNSCSRIICFLPLTQDIVEIYGLNTISCKKGWLVVTKNEA